MKGKGISIILLFFMTIFFACTQGGDDKVITDTGSETSDDPRIAVLRQNVIVYSGSGPYPFGNVAPTKSSNPVTFTMNNSGGGDLVISAVSITGADAGDFSHDVAGALTVAASGATSFTVTFSPAASTEGDRNAQLNIEHNDLVNADSPFIIKLTGNVTADAPEINVQDDLNNNILSGGTKHFGSCLYTETLSKEFTIENLGTDVLNVTSITPEDAEVTFTGVTLPVAIDPDDDISFDVQIAPSTAGYITWKITIANNDNDESSYTFTVTGNAEADPEPEINIFGGTAPNATNIVNAGSYSGFPDTSLGGSNSVTFTIQNVGSSALTIPAGISISPGDFTVTSPPGTTIDAGEISEFTIQFTPTVINERTASISIANNDLNENPYDFVVSGNGVDPEIVVTPTNCPYGGVTVNSSGPYIPILIENTGNDILTFTSIALGGADPAMFSLNSNIDPVSPGYSKTITVLYTPAASGPHSASIIITNNDSDEGVVTVTLSGTGVEADINVRDAAVDLPDDTGTHAYGNRNIGSTLSETYTIQNTSATTSLQLSGIFVSGTNSDEFLLNTSSTNMLIGAGGSTTFAVSFEPASVGAAKTATVRIINNDPDDEGDYTFTMTGNGIGIPIAKVLPENYNFGSVTLYSSSSAIPFTIENTGTADLTLSLPVTIAGADNAHYSIGAQPTSPVTSGSSATFTVVFSPTAAGALNDATVNIGHDAAGSPDTIDLDGFGAGVPNIDITGVAAFGGQDIGSSSAGTVFTIDNTSADAALNLSGSPYVVITGVNSSMFSVSVQPGTPILANGSTTFTVIFSPTSTGAKSATLTVYSDDPDENPFTLEITGTGIGIPIAKVLPENYNFGSVTVTSSSSAIPFTIENTGTANLTLTLPVTITGANSAHYSIGAQPTSPVTSGSSTTFTVVFSPIAAGALNDATVNIAHDAAGSPDTIDLDGFGAGVPNIDITGAAAFGDQDIGSSSAGTVFTIDNTSGDAALNLSGPPYVVITGVNSSMFSVSVQPGTPILASGSDTFTVIFSPTSTGAKSVMLTVYSDDPDENPFTLEITGTGTQVGEIIDSNPGVGEHSSIAVDNPKVYIAYYDYSNADLKFASSSNTGSTWSSKTIVENIGGYAANERNISLAVNGANLYISYYKADDNTLRFQKSTDSGINWLSSAARLDGGSQGSQSWGFSVAKTAASVTGLADTYGYQLISDSNATSPDFVGTDVPAIANNTYDLDVAIDGGAAVLSFGIINTDDWDTIASAIQSALRTATSSIETVEIVGGMIKITSATTGPSSSVSISAGTAGSGGGNLLTYIDVSVANITTNLETAVAGSNNSVYTCSIVVDGSVIPVSLNSSDVLTLDNVVTGINADIIGATVSFDDTNDEIDILSSSSGMSSTISIIDSGSLFASIADANANADAAVDGTNVPDVGKHSSIAINGPGLYISYYDDTNDNLKFISSLDSGVTWESAVTVDNGAIVGQYTSIEAIDDRAVDGDDIYISYYDGNSNNLLINASTDGGSNWNGGGPPQAGIIIDDGGGTNIVGQWSSVAALEGALPVNDEIYISYFDATANNLLYQVSADGGSTWNGGGPPQAGIIIDDGGGTNTVGQYSSIYVIADRVSDGDDIYISYYDATGGDLFLQSSIDGGSSWLGSATTVDSGGLSDVGQFSAISIISGGSPVSDQLFISYYDDTNTNLKVAISSDGGLTW